MADPCAARPPDWNIAGLGELEKMGKASVPWHGEATAGEGNTGARANLSRGRMGRPGGAARDSGCDGGFSAEYLRVDAGTRNSPGLQLCREAGKETGWPAEVEVRFLRYTMLLH